MRKTATGKAFSICAEDLIEYAKLAIVGGEQAINAALGRAANKIASVINRKCENLLLFKPLDTPFPELRRRK